MEYTINNISDTVKTVTFQKLPTTAEELRNELGEGAKNPFVVLAMLIASLNVYTINKENSLEMIDILRGPRPMTPSDKLFIRDRFLDGKDYLPRSYFSGSSPQNNYEPTSPWTVKIEEMAYSRQQFNDGYFKLFVRSSGADSPRGVTLRTKPSTGEWFAWEYSSLVVGIRIPTSKDPWA